MFIVLPSNVDYLLDDVRLHVGDTEKKRFSDSIIRAAIVGGVKMLQRRWRNRYLIYVDGLLAEAPEGYDVPSGYVYAALPDGYGVIPSGLKENDVLRNPYHVFIDPGTSPISQEDEYAVVLAASIILRKSHLTSSAETFQSWSEGEFSFSNLASQRAQGDLYAKDMDMLDAYFKKRLTGPLKSTFGKVL